MKRMILIALVLAVGCAVVGWRGRFDEQFAAALNAGTPIPAVGWYKLDGNALDSSGNGYDGTWGGTEAYTNGYFAGTQAAVFNGTSSQIGLTTNFNFSGSSSFSVSLWARFNSLPHEQSLIGVWGNDVNARAWRLVPVLSNMQFVTTSTGAWMPQVKIETTPVLSIGDWTHVSVVRNGVDTTIYVDGTAVANSSQGGLVYDTGGSTIAKIGAYGSSIGTAMVYFNGFIDDVRIYNRALSAANIARIMESQDNDPLEELQ